MKYTRHMVVYNGGILRAPVWYSLVSLVLALYVKLMVLEMDTHVHNSTIRCRESWGLYNFCEPGSELQLPWPLIRVIEPTLSHLGSWGTHSDVVSVQNERTFMGYTYFNDTILCVFLISSSYLFRQRHSYNKPMFIQPCPCNLIVEWIM